MCYVIEIQVAIPDTHSSSVALVGLQPFMSPTYLPCWRYFSKGSATDRGHATTNISTASRWLTWMLRCCSMLPRWSFCSYHYCGFFLHHNAMYFSHLRVLVEWWKLPFLFHGKVGSYKGLLDSGLVVTVWSRNFHVSNTSSISTGFSLCWSSLS